MHQLTIEVECYKVKSIIIWQIHIIYTSPLVIVYFVDFDGYRFYLVIFSY